MNRKIGIEVQRLFRRKKHGMEVVASEMIRQIQKMDKTSQYVVFAKDDEDSISYPSRKNMKFETPSGRTYFDWEQFSLPKAVRKANVDFLHSTCNTSALNVKVPLLLTLHDIIYLENLNFKGTAYQNFGNLYRKIIVPKVVDKSKYIITVSNFEKKAIVEKLKVPEDKVIVIHNAVSEKFNNKFLDETIKEFKEKYSMPEKFILFLGNTAPKKNTRNVILAYIQYCLNIHNPLPLVILDYGKTLVEQLLQESGHSDLLKNFIFPGFVNADKMPLMYNAAHVFLYPSLRESFGLPILESMRCGTPVITSNTSSMPEVAGDAAILVDPFSVNDIAQKLDSLLSNNVLYENIKAKGLERAAGFSWEKAANKLLSVYDKMY